VARQNGVLYKWLITNSMARQARVPNSATDQVRRRIPHAVDEPKNRQRELIQNLAAAIYVCDSNGFITFYNKAAVVLWGREPEIGKDLWCGSWKIFETDGITPVPLDSCPMAIALKEGHSVRGKEIIVERPDGSRHHIMPYPDPVFNASGKIVEAVNMLVDITDIKKKEKEIQESELRYRQLAEELEKRVEDRTADLRESNASLEQINAELEQFAFIASHDMQEPLRKIKTLALRLEDQASEGLNEAARTYLTKIKYSSDRMAILIKGILDLTRLDQFENEAKLVDLNDILKKELSDLEIITEEKKAIITSDRLPFVKAIPLQMGQLFHNIIINSLKFCREEVPCELNISSRMLSNKEIPENSLNANLSYCELIFKDNGIGFSAEYADTVFQIFKRLNSREKYEGTGIGLALCRKIVNLHRGKIFAQSRNNEGTAIHVILPFA
jgi:signal transduction histidine kinase